MNAPLAEQADGEVATRPLGVVVGPVTFPRILERPEIVTRSAENRIVYDDYHRWAGSMQEDFVAVLGDNLAALLNTRRVVLYPDAAPFEIAYRITVDVQQFDGRRGEDVTLRARWTISAGAGGGPLAVEQSTIRETTGGETHSALVSAHSAAVAVLSRAVASSIETLEAEK
jgi:uncharacterized lipoprotein YmbA